jgi:hypothetical protein
MSERDDNSDLVWGALGIKEALGLRSEEQVKGLLRSGKLDGVVQRVGRRLVASRRALLEHFTKPAQGA